jgi:hypothetical protein
MNPVAICNMALGFIGAKRISQLVEQDPLSVEEEYCVSFYEPDVRVALEAKAWLFATGSIDLGLPAPSGDAAFPVKFVLPTTVCRPLAVDDGSGEFDLAFERRGMFVFVENTAKCILKGTLFNADPQAWTPTFCLAVAHLMASHMAGPLMDKAPLGIKHGEFYRAVLMEAGTLDASASTPQVPRPSANSAIYRR